MRNRIGNTSSNYSSHTPSERSGSRSSASGSARSFQTGSQLSRFASRLSSAGEAPRATSSARYDHHYEPAPTAVYQSEYGSVASSVYESANSASLPGAMSGIGAGHDSSRDLFEINLDQSGRRSETGSDLFEIDLDRRSGVAAGLSQAGTPTERSFHLSERGSVASALRNGRLGYSSDSSRRLTSYEGSSRAGSATANSDAGSVVSSYNDSLTPSDRSALRAAQGLGRFAATTLHNSEGSLDSEYSAYLHEGDDFVAPLRPSKFRPISSTAPSDPYSVAAGSTSRRLSRAPSFSGRIDDTHRPSVDSDWSSGDSHWSGGDSGRMSQFGGADVHSLADAGAGPSSGPRPRQLWELLQEEH